MESSEIYTLEEMAEKLDLSPEVLESCLREKILEPSTLADGTQPLFTPRDFPLLEQVKQLFEMGYSTADIKKISKKIGLPGARGGRKKRGDIRNLLTVGELAKSSGLNARTLKYWEERGLIEPTRRSEGGFRLYEERWVKFCRQIQDLQLFSYSLDEIRDLIRIFGLSDAEKDGLTGEKKPDRQTVEQAAEMLTDLSERIQRLSYGIERWKKRMKSFQAALNVARKQLQKSPEPVEETPKPDQEPPENTPEKE